MKDFFSNIIEADFMPHGHCYFWKPEILWLNVGGDLLIAIAYFSLPLLLFYFARKRTDLTHKYVFMLFAAFIFACGTTHVIDIWTVWIPTYRLEGVVKVITGFLSISTAIVVYRSVPVLLSLPSQDQLQALNRQLQVEVDERRKAQEELRLVNQELEQRVAERTEQLLLANQELEREVQVRTNAQQELQTINHELQVTNNELDNFVYCASHDLKAPILNIEGLLDVLVEEMPAPDENVQHILGRLDGSLKQINRTINDLTAVSMIKQKQGGNGSAGEISLTEVLNDVIESVGGLVERSGALITTDFSAYPATTIQRKDLISIFYNLLTNAIKYRSPDRAPIVNFSTKVEEDYIVLSVADNGIGVELHGNQKKMFSLFKRLHDHVEGSGVGLYIVKRIMENYNGSIDVASEVGSGTTFMLRFPRTKLRAGL